MIYFVTENWLKQYTPITANIDAVKLVPFVATQCDMRIQPILGSYFYNHLLTAYNAQTLTPDETTLVEKIKPAIAWRSAQDCVLGLSYALKNKGVQAQSGDYSEPVTFQEIAHLQDSFGQKAEFYETRLIKYLEKNKALFSQFTDAQNDSDIAPIKDTNTGFNDFFEII